MNKTKDKANAVLEKLDEINNRANKIDKKFNWIAFGVIMLLLVLTLIQIMNK